MTMALQPAPVQRQPACSVARPPAAAAAATPAAAGRRGAPCAPACAPAPRRQQQRRASLAAASSSGFHQSLLVATERAAELPPLPGPLEVREAEADDELQAAAWLRALSFYRYPAERKFAAEVHRTMVAEEEYKTLKLARINRRLDGDKPDCRERSACLVALCPAAGLTDPASGEPLDDRLLVEAAPGGSSSSGWAGSTYSSAAHASGHADSSTYYAPNGGGSGSSSSSGGGGGAAGGQLAVVGTLDLYAVRALPGELLIGNSQNAAYLANVCTAPEARRRGVGEALLRAARQLAAAWGVDDLYVHTMAVNEIAARFYERHGFVVEKEESSNQAHYRGRCLDGIEGRGRTLLLRDTVLQGR